MKTHAERQSDLRYWFGTRVKLLRSYHGMTQMQLATGSGISRAQIAHIERGARRIPIAMIEKLAKGLNVTVLFLLSGNNQPQSPATNPATLSENTRP
jgi:transcriptional regulator with XRE-family HTH domain